MQCDASLSIYDFLATSIIFATSHAPNDVKEQSDDVIRSLVDGVNRAFRMVDVTL